MRKVIIGSETKQSMLYWKSRRFLHSFYVTNNDNGSFDTNHFFHIFAGY